MTCSVEVALPWAGQLAQSQLTAATAAASHPAPQSECRGGFTHTSAMHDATRTYMHCALLWLNATNQGPASLKVVIARGACADGSMDMSVVWGYTPRLQPVLRTLCAVCCWGLTVQRVCIMLHLLHAFQPTIWSACHAQHLGGRGSILPARGVARCLRDSEGWRCCCMSQPSECLC
jgi:hypothetical protein